MGLSFSTSKKSNSTLEPITKKKNPHNKQRESKDPEKAFSQEKGGEYLEVFRSRSEER